MGVTNINEVLQKFQGQKETHSHLLELQQQNEARLKELKQKKLDTRKYFDELKYSGESKHSHSQRMMEECTEHLKVAEEKRKESRLKYQKVSKVLMDLRTGIKHLLERLEGVPQLVREKPRATHRNY